MKLEWKEDGKGGVSAEIGSVILVTVSPNELAIGVTVYDADLWSGQGWGPLRGWTADTLDGVKAKVERALPDELRKCVAVGQAAERALRGEP